MEDYQLYEWQKNNLSHIEFKIITKGSGFCLINLE